MKKYIIVYGVEECPWTERVKEIFEEKKITFKFKDVLTDLRARDEMVVKTMQYGTPVIDVDGKIILGMDSYGIFSAVFE